MTAGLPASALLVSVCSEIGRGHPGYLDSVLLALDRLAPTALPKDRRYCLSDLCTGVSARAWHAVELAYRFGGMGGIATWLYNRSRKNAHAPSRLALNLLGSCLRPHFEDLSGICIVDHPLLAHILSPVCRVAYVHGEIAAPSSSAVPGAWRTFVPLESTASRLRAHGVERQALSLTGLIIEPEMLAHAEAAFNARIERLGSTQPLTVGLFTSGAFPRPHMEMILSGVLSLVRAGHRAIVFWGMGWLRAAKFQVVLRKHGLADEQVRMVWARTRPLETTRTAALLSELDCMVAAAHERTNWAVGLGLPMFAFLPHIGPFAFENFTLAQEQGVCLPLGTLRDAGALGSKLDELRASGCLNGMARAGWGRHLLTGAESCARALLAGT